METKCLVDRYPVLFHMAEEGTWASIRANGLLSTTAVLDHFGIKGTDRVPFESAFRSEKMPVGPKGKQIVLRDQKPMPPGRLETALRGETTTRAWYELINGKVFLWAREERLHGLLSAKHYANLRHDVLVIDTASLVATHEKRIWLCHMNSGSTYRIPHYRGPDIFRRIIDYPVRPRGGPQKEVAELVVDYSIPDIADHVREVRTMKGPKTLSSRKP